ncbi:MAG: penicillin-binding protein activator [Pseudomonadota bacterium]
MKNTILPLFITCLFASTLFLTSCMQTNGRTSDYISSGTQANPYIYTQPINVALLLPLSGKNAALGQSMLQASQLALFDVNNPNLNITPLDTKGTASGAAAAAQEAIANRSQLIIGPVFAQSVQAVKPIAKSRNISVIGFSTDQTLADPSTFLMGFMPSTQAQEIATYAARSGLRRVSVIAPRDTYGDIVTKSFEDALRRNGGMIKQIVRFAPNDPELGANVASLSSDIDAVFIPANENDARAISDYLDQNNMTAARVKRLGTGLWDNRKIARSVTLQGGLFANPSPQKYDFFKNKYKTAYGSDPARIASLAFDATALAATLLQNGAIEKNPRPFSPIFISNPNGFAGADGVFRFAPNGIVERKLSILELRNGSIAEVSPAEKRF